MSNDNPYSVDQAGRVLLKTPRVDKGILGLCDSARTENTVFLGAHSSNLQTIYTTYHESAHSTIFLTTVFGTLQRVIACLSSALHSGCTLPHGVSNYDTLLAKLSEVSFKAHEGYATAVEFMLHRDLSLAGYNVPPPPAPTKEYIVASEPYIRVVNAIPEGLKPVSSWMLRALAEIVFSPKIVDSIIQTELIPEKILPILESIDVTPDSRVITFCDALVKHFESNLTPAWEPLLQLVAEATRDRNLKSLQIAASLRSHPSGADGVLFRHRILEHCRKAILHCFHSVSVGSIDANWKRSVVRFHNWSYKQYGHPVIKAEMRDFDDDPVNSAQQISKTPQASAGVSPQVSVVSISSPPPVDEFLAHLMATPDAFIAIQCHSPTEDELTANRLKLRFVRFQPRWEAWNGPGTQPYQRIFLLPPAIDITFPTADLQELLKALGRTIHILFHSRHLDQRAATFVDNVIDKTYAVQVSLIHDHVVEGMTDEEKLHRLEVERKHGTRIYIPFSTDAWEAFYWEMADGHYVGMIIGRMAIQQMFASDKSWVKWRTDVGKIQIEAVKHESMRFCLGALSTFAKLWVVGCFLPISVDE